MMLRTSVKLTIKDLQIQLNTLYNMDYEWFHLIKKYSNEKLNNDSVNFDEVTVEIIKSILKNNSEEYTTDNVDNYFLLPDFLILNDVKELIEKEVKDLNKDKYSKELKKEFLELKVLQLSIMNYNNGVTDSIGQFSVIDGINDLVDRTETTSEYLLNELNQSISQISKYKYLENDVFILWQVGNRVKNVISFDEILDNSNLQSLLFKKIQYNN